MGLGSFLKIVPTLFSNLASKDNLFMSKDKKLNSLLYFTENELKKKNQLSSFQKRDST